MFATILSFGQPKALPHVVLLDADYRNLGINRNLYKITKTLCCILKMIRRQMQEVTLILALNIPSQIACITVQQVLNCVTYRFHYLLQTHFSVRSDVCVSLRLVPYTLYLQGLLYTHYIFYWDLQNVGLTFFPRVANYF